MHCAKSVEFATHGVLIVTSRKAQPSFVLRAGSIACALTAATVLTFDAMANAPNAAQKGRAIFEQNCISCHGEDGKAQVNVMSHAADLTDPDTWKRGHSDADIFNAIKNGGIESMPPFKAQLSDDQIWLLVAFIKG